MTTVFPLLNTTTFGYDNIINMDKSIFQSKIFILDVLRESLIMTPKFGN